jgi:hypothetical protein
MASGELRKICNFVACRYLCVLGTAKTCGTSNTYIFSRRFSMTKKMLKRMVWLLCISVALTGCKEKTEIVEVVRAIETITVREQAADGGRFLRAQF